MTLPVDYDTVAVRGGFVYLDGTPAAGYITFTGKTVTYSAGTHTFVLPTTIKVPLVNGSFTVNLPATNDPNMTPNGWTYTVEETFDKGGGSTYDIDVPIAAKTLGIDLDTVAPVTPASGSPTAFVTLTAFYSRGVLAPGMWRAVPGPSIANYSVAVGTERAQLLLLPPGTKLQSIACWVAATVATTSVRFGIRADNAYQAGALLLDAGVAPATAGIASVPINFTVPANANGVTPLWLTVTPQGSGAVTFVGCLTTAETQDATTASAAIGYRGSQAQTGVPGALPNTFVSSSNLSTAPIVAVQAL